MKLSKETTIRVLCFCLGAVMTLAMLDYFVLLGIR